MMPRRRALAKLSSIDSRSTTEYSQAEGAAYKPWLRVQDIPSLGRVHRIKGWKHGRVHHLLSDLEARVFFIYEWSLQISDIREQYPLLPLDETLAIAKECGVAHPADIRSKQPMVMTTDFVLTIKKGLAATYHARTVKYAADLIKARTLEKLEIERRYWQARRVDWGIVTEQQASTALAQNVKWVHPFLRQTDLYPLDLQTIRRIASDLSQRACHSDLPLRDLARDCDEKLALARGQGLKVVRHLLANRIWRVNVDSAEWQRTGA
jgi:TnsA-like endonuclease N terminal/TnsA endonuclease C terminal